MADDGDYNPFQDQDQDGLFDGIDLTGDTDAELSDQGFTSGLDGMSDSEPAGAVPAAPPPPEEVADPFAAARVEGTTMARVHFADHRLSKAEHKAAVARTKVLRGKQGIAFFKAYKLEASIITGKDLRKLNKTVMGAKGVRNQHLFGEGRGGDAGGLITGYAWLDPYVPVAPKARRVKGLASVTTHDELEAKLASLWAKGVTQNKTKKIFSSFRQQFKKNKKNEDPVFKAAATARIN